jgi:hypothetical protein
MNLIFGHCRIGCPTTGPAGNCLSRLPFDNALSEPGQAEVVEAVRQFECWDLAGR